MLLLIFFFPFLFHNRRKGITKVTLFSFHEMLHCIELEERINCNCILKLVDTNNQMVGTRESSKARRLLIESKVSW